MAYISKRTGEEVDALLDKIENGDFDIEVDTSLSETSNNAIANETVTKELSKKVNKINGKGLSSNDYSDEDKSLVNTIPNLVTNEQFEEVQTATSESLTELAETLEAKADTNGYYPDMTVGKSNNLVGRGDTQDATINFRPSGGVPDVGNGMNITDGTARISAIKGNSVVYNQLNKGVKSIPSNATKFGVTLNFTVGSRLIRAFGTTTNVAGDTNFYLSNSNYPIEVIKGHYYLLEIRGNKHFSISAYSWTVGTTIKTNAVCLATQSGVMAFAYKLDPTIPEGTQIDETFEFIVRDLTQMFGVGNEPTTVAEYYQRKPINIADEFADNAGSLVDMKVKSLISTSDNAFNPLTQTARVSGGKAYNITTSTGAEFYIEFYNDEIRAITIYEVDGKYTFPANGYCQVISSYGDELGEICVCLEHSYEKPIKPYEQDIKDLSFIKEIATKQGELLFPNGMRSAGSVYDEIRYDVTKKKWVAAKRLDKVVIDSYTNIVKDSNHPNAFTVKYQDLGISSTAKTYSSGAKLNNYSLPNSYSVSMKGVYFTSSQILVINLGEESGITTVEQFKQKLSSLPFEMVFEIKPIEVEIPNSENWNLDYLVWDFGTEEALVSDSTLDNPIPSAPFRAEINYEPNAVDDIRWSIKYIRALEQRVLALEQKVVQETNIEE